MRTTLHTAFLVLLLPTLSVVAQDPDVRSVQVSITLKDFSNAPLSDVPISCTTRAKKCYAATASDGHATLAVDVRDDERVMFFVLNAENAADRNERQRGSGRIAAISRSCVLPKTVVIPLDPQQTVYQKELVLGAGRQVKIRRLDAAQSPVLGFFVTPTNAISPTFHRDGTHEAAGVPNSACVLYAADTRSGILQAVPVPASSGDLDLGDVVLPLSTTDATLQVTFTNVNLMDERTRDARTRAFAVSIDGQTLLDLCLQGNRTVRHFGSEEPSQVPAGEYWICPTSLAAGITADTLLTLVRSGVDLSASGIPKIVVPVGGAIEQTIDAAAAQKAILLAGGIIPG